MARPFGPKALAGIEFPGKRPGSILNPWGLRPLFSSGFNTLGEVSGQKKPFRGLMGPRHTFQGFKFRFPQEAGKPGSAAGKPSRGACPVVHIQLFSRHENTGTGTPLFFALGPLPSRSQRGFTHICSLGAIGPFIPGGSSIPPKGGQGPLIWRETDRRTPASAPPVQLWRLSPHI